jgi:hypothetical protein
MQRMVYGETRASECSLCHFLIFLSYVLSLCDVMF